MRNPARVVLGERYLDTVTGVEGVATARHEYQFGCVRVTLEWQKDGEPKAESFDEQRLRAADGRPVELTARTGGPGTVPAARPTPRPGGAS